MIFLQVTLDFNSHEYRKKSCYWLKMLRDQYDIFYLFVYRPEIVNNIKESVLYSIYILLTMLKEQSNIFYYINALSKNC